MDPSAATSGRCLPRCLRPGDTASRCACVLGAGGEPRSFPSSTTGGRLPVVGTVDLRGLVAASSRRSRGGGDSPCPPRSSSSSQSSPRFACCRFIPRPGDDSPTRRSVSTAMVARMSERTASRRCISSFEGRYRSERAREERRRKNHEIQKTFDNMSRAGKGREASMDGWFRVHKALCENQLADVSMKETAQRVLKRRETAT